MARRQPRPYLVEELAHERTTSDPAGSPAGVLALVMEPLPDGVPKSAVDDRLMQPGVPQGLVADLADVDGIAEEGVEGAARERVTTGAFPVLVEPDLRANALPIERALEEGDGAELAVAPIDEAHRRGFIMLYDQLVVLDRVAERRDAAHPHALLLAGRDLVADALARHLALELREGEEDVEGETPH